MSEVQKLMDDIHQWADNTFGKERTALAPLRHLQKEVRELQEAIAFEDKPNQVELEFADCFILLLNAAAKYGLTFDRMVTAATVKMEINKARKWGKPDADGVAEHIRDGE